MNKNKKIILTSLVVILTAIGIVATLALRNNNDSNSTTSTTPIEQSNVNDVDYGPPKDDDVIGESSKDEIIKEGNSTDQPTNTQPSISVRLTQNIQQEKTVYIRAIIEGTTSGTCEVVLTKGAHTITRQAQVSTQASYATCQGFNIPVTELPESGVWNITLTVQKEGVQPAKVTAKVDVTK